MISLLTLSTTTIHCASLIRTVHSNVPYRLLSCTGQVVFDTVYIASSCFLTLPPTQLLFSLHYPTSCLDRILSLYCCTLRLHLPPSLSSSLLAHHWATPCALFCCLLPRSPLFPIYSVVLSHTLTPLSFILYFLFFSLCATCLVAHSLLSLLAHWLLFLVAHWLLFLLTH